MPLDGIKFKMLDASEAELTISGTIGGWFGVDGDYFRQQVKTLAGKTLNVHINSPGGDILAGNEIYNALKEHDAPVNVEIGALCASMGTVIAMAGTSISMASNGLFMIHNPFVMIEGDADQMRKMADVMDKMKANIIQAYRAQTGLSVKELSDLMDAETWLTAEEARAQGFIDSISGEADEESMSEASNQFSGAFAAAFKNAATFSSKFKAQTAQANGGKSGSHPATPVPPKQPENPKNQIQKQEPNQMTPEEIQAEAQKQAKAMFEAKLNRDKEIRAMVIEAKKRDNKDFSPLAETFFDDSTKTVADFAMAMAKSDIKPVAIGSGIEVIEPLDTVKGSIGFQVLQDPQLRASIDKWKNGTRHGFACTIEIPSVRNATQTSSGLTSIQYVPGVVELGVRKMTVEQLLSGGATNATTLRYQQESAFTNAATSVTETGALPNLGVTYTEVDATVKDVGGYIEESENLMADYLSVASFINARIQYMVDRTVEDQIVNGAGAGSDLTGLLAFTGIQTQAKSTDTNADAIHKAITSVRFVPNAVQANVQGGYEPDAILINPLDWELLRLKKDTAGQYLAGGPFTGAYGNGGYSNVYMLWGLPCVVTPVIAAGTALVGAFKECAMLWQRQGLTVEMTNSNGTNFVNRLVTIRAARRLALAVPKPNGFCQVTGIA